MFKFIEDMFFKENKIISEVPEYEYYKEEYKDLFKLTYDGINYTVYDIKRDNFPLFVSRLIFEDDREYTEEANAKIYFINQCKSFTKYNNRKRNERIV